MVLLLGFFPESSVRRPLDGVQIHAFLVHLPQGRELAQLADLGAQQLDRVVDLFLGGEATDRKTDGAVGEFIRASERPQDVRGLEARRSAGRARGNRHVLDPHDQRLALDEVEADVEVARYAPLHVAVDVHLFHVLEAVQELVAQGADAYALGRHLELRDAERLAHADDLVGRERPRAQAPLVAAAVDLRLDAHARLPAHVQRADALRAVHLVRGHRQKVRFQLLQVDRDLSGGLHRVAVEDDAFRAADLADLGYRLDHADLVVHHHHRHEDGIGAEGRLEFFQVEQPVLLRIEVSRFEPLALELAHRVEHRLVLGLHRDDVLAFALVEIRRAFDGEVVAFGRAGGPDDLFRIGIEERRDELGELHRIQVLVHLVVELGPEVMGHAALLVVAVFLPAALRRVQRLVHRSDDVRDRHSFETTRERVASAGPANAVDQRVTPQLAEELFQIRERNALPLADTGERHRTLAAVHGEVQHRGHCESSFGRQSHGCTLKGFRIPDEFAQVYPIPRELINYLLTTLGPGEAACLRAPSEGLQ